MMTRERMDLQYEAWRLHDVEGWAYHKIAAHQSRPHTTVFEDAKQYRMMKLTPEQRAKYADKFKRRPKKRNGPLVPAHTRCKRCGIPRENGRIKDVENPNADILCDACHVLLSAGVRHTDGELSGERLVELGYGVTISMREA